MVEAARPAGSEEVLRDDRLWECLTCGRCIQVCPSDVRFLGFIRDMRTVARGADVQGHCSHGATIQTWMRIMTDPDLKQDRLGWLTEDGLAPDSPRGLRVSDRSDTVYFVGCLPYYEILFGKIGAQGVQIAQSAIKVLNRLGIEPIVLADERCCGHDLLWEGEVDTYRNWSSSTQRCFTPPAPAGSSPLAPSVRAR